MPPSESQNQSKEPSIQSVSIEKIRMDGGTQPRSKLYEEVVDEYAEDMRHGAIFPPVILYYDGEEYWLADGFHRVRAKEKVGENTIEAEVRIGKQRDAVLYAVGANASHGLRRTNADKHRAVERLLRDQEWRLWSDNAIAKQCGVSHGFVGKIRRRIQESTNDNSLTLRRGMDNRVIDTSNIGTTRQESKKAIKRQRKKKQDSEPTTTSLAQSRKVKKGEIWKLGKSHYLFCGDSSSIKFQKLLPSEIGLFMIFMENTESWGQQLPPDTKNALSFFSSYGEDIDLRNLRQIVENCLVTTTEADDVVMMVNLPDPSIFILMESLYCLCYCAEPDPQRCTDALSAWGATKQPIKKI